MSAVETLAALCPGEAGAERRLLNSCMCEGFGVRAYGRDAIGRLFREQPTRWSPHAQIVRGERGVAVFDPGEPGTVALVADVFDGRIGRLWRVDEVGRVSAGSGTSVPFDPDMSQTEPAVGFRAEDHPDLAAEAVPALSAFVASGDWRDAGSAPRRGFVVRALSDGPCHAALLAIHATGGPLATSGWSYAALSFRVRGAILMQGIMIEGPGDAPRTAEPRVPVAS